MRLMITDFSTHSDLNEAIMKYYTLLRMSFETNLYKIFETVESQIYRFSVAPGQPLRQDKEKEAAEINFECPKCKGKFLIQANLEENIPLADGRIPYPIDNDIFKCPKCNAESNISRIRLQIEAQSGKRISK
jgi:transcription initiation factor IIE alpha subunit